MVIIVSNVYYVWFIIDGACEDLDRSGIYFTVPYVFKSKVKNTNT